MPIISITGAGTSAANQLYTLGAANRYTAANGYYLDPVGFAGYGVYDNTDVLLYSSATGVLGPYSVVTGAAPAPAAYQQAEYTSASPFLSDDQPNRRNSRWINWVKILMQYQAMPGADSINDPKRTDTLLRLKKKVLAALNV